MDVISVLLPDFSKLTTAQRAMAPVVQLSATEIDFGEMGNKKTLKKHITITNTGRSDLKMEDIQVTSPALNVSLKKQVLAPGKSTKMYISVNAKYLRSNAKRTPRVLMITNDPKHPKNEITIKVKK